MKRCATCGGTGWQILNRSWFRSDGYRRGRCGICHGSGSSSFKDETAFVKEQAKRRAALEQEGE